MLKAQLVAFLTKKLLDTPAFVKGVESAHGAFSELQSNAYTALLKATEEDGKPHRPPPPLKDRPQASQPVKVQNRELLDFIERTKKDLEASRGGKS